MQMIPLLANTGQGVDPIVIGVIAAILVIVAIVFFVMRSKPKPPADIEVKADAPKPKKSALDDRLEVEAPVEITDDMSLAEIKRAKAAKITGDKGKRETAVEATEKSKVDHEAQKPKEDAGEDKLEEVSAGWDAMLEEESVSETGTKLSEGLAKTRTGFIGRLSALFKGEELNENLVDEIEEVLFTADIGTSAANDILEAVQEHLNGDQKQDPATVWAFVRQYVLKKLKAREGKLDLDAHQPFVILVVGVNGVGKTTTIGKLASKYKKQGKSVLMVAGDTFRAAAVEQLGVWGERTNIPVHQGEQDSDPSSVIYAGIERGAKEGFDVIICDTAGRLHTKANLLDELRKMNRVASKVIDTAPHETILVLDANTGQNAIQQAKLFKEAVDISGIVLTKLDGTAKGGVILGICEELDSPIRFIGIGESVTDLREFKADEFVEALFM